MAPRPGSRAARMTVPLARGVLADIAAEYGVCLHPVVLRRTDTATGATTILEVPCGATLASKCAPCAEKARRLRMQQLREGWHLDVEPAITPRPADDGEQALVTLRAHLEYERAEAAANGDGQAVADLDTAIAEVDQTITESDLRGRLTPPSREPVARRQRSTRRRADAAELPRQKIEPRTVGRTFTGNDGRTFRPSLLITPTLGSYGPVHSARRPRRPHCDCGTAHPDADPLVGTPLDPETYDYRHAALDAIHFARLLDRFWQNLRRAVGWHVQYGGCIELQRRLAPHAHFAVRGTIPRKLINTVAAATYHQVWWPAHDVAKYTPDRPPSWDDDAGAFIDPATAEVLPTWDEALDTLDQGEGAEPAHVARLGTIDVRGIIGDSKDAERSIRYVTKYLAKDLTEAVAPTSDPQRAHFDRLHDQLRQLPCAATCANWLLYGVQPRNAHGKLKPGQCRGKVHQRATLGFTGRRVLISRQWSNKTLTDHRADNRAWVRDLLGLSATEHAEQGKPGQRYRYQVAKRGDPDVPPVEHRILRAISTRVRWRKAIEQAQQLSAKEVAA